MCKQNIDLIRGRVLLQTLPSSAYSTEKTVEHALQYDREFARAGIGRDRYCVKIPATGPALKAAETLSEQGIATLGTALFGLPQAIACGQAGCKYVSPYFNGKPSTLGSREGVKTRLTLAQRCARTRTGPCGRTSRTRRRSIPCRPACSACSRRTGACTRRRAKSSRC